MGRFPGWKIAAGFVVILAAMVVGIFVSTAHRGHGAHAGSLSSDMVATPAGATECAGGPTGSLSQSQITTLVGTGVNGPGFSTGYARCWDSR